MILIRSKRNSDCRENDVSDFALYQNRRAFIRQLGVTAAGIACAPSVFGDGKNNCNNIEYPKPDSPPTDLRSITHYNNYYEFSPNKEAVAVLAQELTTSPWTLTIKGEVEKEITLDVDTINTLCVSERIYRLRCVEGWSMIIPWQGVGLHQVIRLAKPLSSAKYVKFIGIERPSEMIGQRRPSLPWTYAEGLRIDEAVHPLTILATGLYGQTLPKQNGAPLRLVVPWKY